MHHGDDWTALVTAHAVVATASVVLGGVLAGRRRKGDRLHRRIGVAWAAAVYFTAISSFGITRLDPGHLSFIHVLSAWTVVSLTVAVWAAVTGRARVHRRWVSGTYAGFIGAMLGAITPPPRLVPQTLVHHPLALAAGASVALALALATLAACRWAPALRGLRPTTTS